MGREENLGKIAAHRAEIDRIDAELVALLNERAGHSLAIRALKPGAGMTSIFDPTREEQILQKVCDASDKTLYDEGLREIYAVLLKVMKENPEK